MNQALLGGVMSYILAPHGEQRSNIHEFTRMRIELRRDPVERIN